MGIGRYLSHPQVNQDPEVPVPAWGLSAIGLARAQKLAHSEALSGTIAIFTSTETKAIQTAAPLAKALGLVPTAIARMGENDRSATGYLQPDAFEETANAFFAHPDQSTRGWETAREAQNRIVKAVNDALNGHGKGDVLFVGHGGVGTLLYCALAGLAITRSHDQPAGGGNYFSFDLATRNTLHSWRPIEDEIL